MGRSMEAGRRGVEGESQERLEGGFAPVAEGWKRFAQLDTPYLTAAVAATTSVH